MKSPRLGRALRPVPSRVRLYPGGDHRTRWGLWTLPTRKALDSWGGVIMEHTEPGGVAGASSNGKCQSKSFRKFQGGTTRMDNLV